MRRQQHGLTFIELIVAIVVIGICVVSVLGLLSSLSMRSAAAMTRTQATAVAASYLEDVLATPYAAVNGRPSHVGAIEYRSTFSPTHWAPRPTMFQRVELKSRSQIQQARRHA